MDSLIQTERSFQKQHAIFLGNKRQLIKKLKEGGLTEKERRKLRYYRNPGLGFKIPKKAIFGSYIDKKCPFTGNVSIRGRLIRGIVKSNKMTRTIIVRRDYLKWDRKYRRYERRHTNIAAHISPAFRCDVGDTVVVGECRPLSKTIRFNVLDVIKNEKDKKFKAY